MNIQIMREKLLREAIFRFDHVLNPTYDQKKIGKQLKEELAKRETQRGDTK